MEIQFIEPCCATRQLPALLREQKVASFQTNGDVTFEHILKGVSSLAGDVLSIRLMVPIVNVAMLRVLAWFGRRGWLKRLQVLTQDKQDGLIRKEVSDTIPSVSCYHHERVVESLLVIDGEKGSVAVTGHFLTSVEPGHRFYTAAIGKADSDHVRMLTATLSPLMRSEDVAQAESVAQGEVTASSQDSEAEETTTTPADNTTPATPADNTTPDPPADNTTPDPPADNTIPTPEPTPLIVEQATANEDKPTTHVSKKKQKK